MALDVTLQSSLYPQMGDSLSPTPATTAEEALASSQDAGAVGAPARDGEGAVGGEETGRDAEAWAAALPPVSYLHRCSILG